MVGIEEDYGVCVRMLARAAGEKPSGKRGKGKEQPPSLFE